MCHIIIINGFEMFPSYMQIILNIEINILDMKILKLMISRVLLEK